MPVLHGQHMKVRADVIFDVEELRELANGESVPHGQGKISDEIRFVRVQHRALDNFTADRIGAIENEKRDAALGRFFHAIGHGRRVGIESDAGVLHIEDERVDAFEHFLGGPKCVAVQAVDRKARGWIFRGREFFVGAAGETMFRAEERNHLHPCRT